MNFTLTQEQYESLVALAKEGTLHDDGTIDQEQARKLDEWLRLIEEANGVNRSIVWVQWQETDAPLPSTMNFPDEWPPNMRRRIELLSRPVSKVDVDAVLAAHAKKPTAVLCTRDPAGVLGYVPVEDFFIT